jgi:hypothetical protein
MQGSRRNLQGSGRSMQGSGRHPAGCSRFFPLRVRDHPGKVLYYRVPVFEQFYRVTRRHDRS